MKIIEKIKALLAKARSTDNENEAIAFLAKAEELMEKHQLDAEDLERDDPIDAHHKKPGTNGAGDWPEFIYSSLARYYGCRIIVHHLGGMKREREVFGRLSAVVTLNEMHPYLVATVRRLGRQYAAEWGMKPDQAARRIGNALMSRINALCAQQKVDKVNTPAASNALVAVDRIDAIIAAKYPRLEAGRSGRKMTNSSARGIANGISLSSQVGGRSSLRIGAR